MSLAGSFLVARTILRDPTFNRTVVLLLAHNDDGALGLVVNRPLKADGLPFPLFDGGPCPSPGLFMLHGHVDWSSPPPEEAVKPELAPGIFIGDASSLNQATEPQPGQVLRFRVFRGYAGWGGGQLENELASGAWTVLPATGELLFDTPVEELWDHLAPPTIPQPSLN
jgi:putative transcriptional regulator